MKELEEKEKRRIIKEKKIKKEKSWEMAKWVHAYIEENNDNWEK